MSSHVVLRERDLANDCKVQEMLKERGETPLSPIEIDEKDDLQLRRAIDLIMSWTREKSVK